MSDLGVRIVRQSGGGGHRGAGAEVFSALWLVAFQAIN